MQARLTPILQSLHSRISQLKLTDLPAQPETLPVLIYYAEYERQFPDSGLLEILQTHTTGISKQLLDGQGPVVAGNPVQLSMAGYLLDYGHASLTEAAEQEARQFLHLTLLNRLQGFYFETGTEQQLTEAAIAIRYLSTHILNEPEISLFHATVDHLYELLTMKWEHSLQGTPESSILPLSGRIIHFILATLEVMPLSAISGDNLSFVLRFIKMLLATKADIDFDRQVYSCFPRYLNTYTGRPEFDNKISWTEGDLTCALLLHKTGLQFQMNELEHMALLVGSSSLMRQDPETTGILSSSFGTGSAGLAHLYRSLHELTGYEGYLEGYEKWMKKTLDLLEEELSLYPQNRDPSDFFEGLTGAGCTLISYYQGPVRKWSHMALL